MPTAGKADFVQNETWHPVIGRLITEGAAGVGALNATDFDVQATATDLEINVSAPSTMVYEGTEHDLGSVETHTLTQGNSSFDRFDTVVFNTSSDSSAVLEGTNETYPTPPDPTGDEVLLSVVSVAQNATDVADSDIFDFRPTHQGADAVRYDNSTWDRQADNVSQALDELQDASTITSGSESAGDLLIYDATDSQYENTALTGGNAVDVTNADASVTLAVSTDGIQTDELDLSITPTWTGEHTFGDGLSIADSNRSTLSGDISLAASDPVVQNLDPNASNRNVSLPAEADGELFVIANRNATVQDLTVQDDANANLTTLNANDVAYCISDGTGWVILPMQGVVN